MAVPMGEAAPLVPGAREGVDVRAAGVVLTGLGLSETAVLRETAVLIVMAVLSVVVVLSVKAALNVRVVEIAQGVPMTKAGLTAVGALIAKPAQVVRIDSNALPARIGSRGAEGETVSPGEIVPIVVIALAERIGPPVADVFKKKVASSATIASVLIRDPIVSQALLVASALGEMIVSPGTIGWSGAIARAVIVQVEIAPVDRVRRALNASVVSARMAVAEPAEAIGIGMKTEVPSITPPARGRSSRILQMLRPMTCSGGAMPPRRHWRQDVRFIASGAHQKCAAPRNFSSF